MKRETKETSSSRNGNESKRVRKLITPVNTQRKKPTEKQVKLSSGSALITQLKLQLLEANLPPTVIFSDDFTVICSSGKTSEFPMLNKMIPGSDLLKHFSADLRPFIRKSINALVRSGREQSLLFDPSPKTNENGSWGISFSLLQNKKPESPFFCATFTSNRKKDKGISPIELNHGEIRYWQVVESAPLALLLVNRNGEIIYANAQTEKLFGWSREELLSENIEILMPERFSKSHRLFRDEFFRTPSSRSMGNGKELFAVRKNGIEFPIEIGLNPIDSSEGQLVIASVIDITDRKSADELFRSHQIHETIVAHSAELEKSNAQLEQFAYIASHDLQEPLRMVSSFMQLLERKYQSVLDETGNQYIHFAVEGAERMKRLIQDLLQYSRIGTNAETKLQIDLNNVIDSLRIVFSENLKETGGVLKSTPLPLISGQVTQIHQLFQNLISNALKYLSKDRKPRVEIHCEDIGEYFQFSVSDNGIGIEKQFYEKIFIIFQRLHHKNQYSGTGIGLSICKKIVERHGGEIWVESEKDKGSTFYFTLKKYQSTINQF